MPQRTQRRGNELPYDVLAGVVPCPKGWLVSPGKLVGVALFVDQPQVVTSLRDVIDNIPQYSAIAIAVAIGLPDQAGKRGRTCDREARQLLGWPRAGAIRSAPCRTVVDAKGYGAAVKRNGGQLDAVSWRLLPRTIEAAAEVQSHRQRTISEVHPELSFFQLNGDRPLTHAKRTPEGLAERRALLVDRLAGSERVLDAVAPHGLTGHLLDATAALWTARRIMARAVSRLPEAPEWNSDGLRMEIVR